jgi:hypothetical protein
MPKGSFATKDAYEVSLGFQEGWGAVTNAVICVHQYNPDKTTGDQLPPFLALALTIQRTDDAGKETDDDPVTEYLKVDKDLDKARPGNADGAEDEDPEDLGDALGTEGNTIWCNDGYKFNSKSKFMVFTKSLESCGFKPEVLGRGFAPDLVGLKAHFKQVPLPKIDPSAKRDPMALVVDKITQYPYEKRSPAKGKATGKATAVAASAKVAPVAKADLNGEDASAAAAGLLIELAAELSGQAVSKQKLFTLGFSRAIKAKVDKGMHKGIQEAFKSDEWLAAQAEAIGAAYDGGEMTFA